METWQLIFSHYNLPTYEMVRDREYLPWRIARKPTYTLGMSHAFRKVREKLEEQVVNKRLSLVELNDFPEEFDYNSLFEYKYIPFFDSYLSMSTSLERQIEKQVKEILFNKIPNAIKTDGYFLIVGPDHSVCISGVLKSLKRVDQMSLVVFDKHLDTSKTDSPNIISRANFVTFLSTILPPSNILLIAPSSEYDESYIRKQRMKGLRVCMEEDIDGSVDKALKWIIDELNDVGLKNVYVSLDLDTIRNVEDVLYKTPPAPFSLNDVLNILNAMKSRFNLIGGDISEFCPNYLSTTTSLDATASAISRLVKSVVIGNSS